MTTASREELHARLRALVAAQLAAAAAAELVAEAMLGEIRCNASLDDAPSLDPIVVETFASVDVYSEAVWSLMSMHGNAVVLGLVMSRRPDLADRIREATQAGEAEARSECPCRPCRTRREVGAAAVAASVAAATAAARGTTP
jgi:hypothetical protein